MSAAVDPALSTSQDLPKPRPLPLQADKEALREAVGQRYSTRTYDGTSLSPEHLAFVQAYLDDPARQVGPFGGKVRIELLRGLPKDKKVGTYGYTKGYDGILAAIAPPQPASLFELAYVLHELVLHLTHLGVNTVWMGGSFSRADIKKTVNLEPGEIIGAMVAFGYKSDRRRLIDVAAPFVLKPAKRKSMDHFYFVGDFSRPIGDSAGPLRGALDLARRAPSAKNRQSWRAVVSPNGARVDIYAAFSLRKEVGTGFRQYACPPEYLDVGTWARSFAAAADADGVSGKFIMDDPDISIPDGEDIEYVASWVRV